MVSEVNRVAEDSTGGADTDQRHRVESVLIMYCGDEIARRLISEWLRMGLDKEEMEERALRLIVDVTGLKITL